MGDIDAQELKVRLGYWIRHNREHGEEFREWAAKAGAAGVGPVEAHLMQAATLMAQATAALEDALQALAS